MQRGLSLLIVWMSLAGIAFAQGVGESVDSAGFHMTIIPTGIRQPEVLKVNTGKKTLMKDGEYGAVYETVRPKTDHILLEITADLSVDPGPYFLETSMIRLGERNHPVGDSYVPIHWCLNQGLEPAPIDSTIIASQAGLILTFEVPAARAESLTLWISGLRMGNVAEIRERRMQKEQMEAK